MDKWSIDFHSFQGSAKFWISKLILALQNSEIKEMKGNLVDDQGKQKKESNHNLDFRQE